MKKLKILMSLLTEENPYQRLQATIAQEIAGNLGVDLQIAFAKNDALFQSEQLLNAIHSSKHSPLDGIVCAPIGTTRTTLMQVARSAVAAGIGWAVLNREIDYQAELRSSFQVPIFSVLPDQEAIGKMQGQQVGMLLPRGGHILYLLGPTGNSVSEKRLAGMQTGLSSGIGLKTLVGDWSKESGFRAVARWLQLRTANAPAIELLASQNDDMVIGAREAFEEMTNGDEKDRWLGIPYVGCDCCPGAGREWVHRGLLASSVINPPTAGLALQMMVQAVRKHLATTRANDSCPGIVSPGRKTPQQTVAQHLDRSRQSARNFIARKPIAAPSLFPLSLATI